MEIQAAEQLVKKKCLPCEGGVDACTLDESNGQLANLEGWYLTHDGQRIRKDWTVKNFMAGLDFFNKVAEIAEEGTPDDFALDGNYPNPFNAETAIRFSIPQMGEVLPARLVIYNAAGQEVLSLLEGEYGAGHYEVKWDGRDAQGNPVSTGVYSYRLTVGDRFTETSQTTLLK